MAPTEVPGPGAPPPPAPASGTAPHGSEPLTADLHATAPRVSTRALVYAVGVVALLVLLSAVVALVILHQPRLMPVPVPSVSSIA